MLARAVASSPKEGEVDSALASAVFALAQICVETGQPAAAIKWLEDPRVGPLTLVKAGNPAVVREGFAAETYRTALRAYIAVVPQQLKKAEAVMDDLEKLVQGSGDEKAAEQLTAIYVSLGRELQQQLKELRSSGHSKELDSVSKAFEVFLDRVTKRDTGGNFATLNWVAETYYSLGNGFDDGGLTVPPKAKAYYEKGAVAYKRLLEMAEKDPKFQAQPDSLISIRLRLAECYRRSGKYDDATKVVLAVLRRKPTIIPAQVQAAQIYQARGVIDPKGYFLAISGGEPGKDGNTIWGWNKLSRMTDNKPKFEETFFESRLNLCDSRYRYAESEKDPERRGKILEAAKQDLWYTYKLHPELGGAQKKARFDAVLKMIQKAQGAQQNGLEEFKAREAAAVSEK